jgi:hypothetical protein
MQIIRTHKNASGKLEIVIEISAEGTESLLEQEEKLAILLNEVGQKSMEELLISQDVSAQVLELGDKKFYKKGVQKKSTKRFMGQ